MPNGMYSEKLCDERHKHINIKFDKLFKKLDIFYIIAFVATVTNVLIVYFGR